jgi:Zn-dependent protease
MDQLASPKGASVSPSGLAASRGFTIARLRGIELRLDWSLAFLFVLVVVDLGGGVFPSWHPDWPRELAWGLGAVTAVLLIVSIALHELAHAIVARLNRIPVRRVTLFIFGGLAEIEGEPKSPGSELAMAAIGPIVSVAIGFAAMSGAKSLLTGGNAYDASAIQALLRNASPLESLLIWVGTVNVTLGVFNLLPGFPLDGGRVLRALLWAVMRDRARATRWAAGAGRGIAWLLMALGLLNVLRGSFGQGVWYLLIGWFLDTAARGSLERSQLRKALENVPITRLMRTEVARVPVDASLETLVMDYVLHSDQALFPVEQDGRFLGVVARGVVGAVARADWPATSVTSVMTPANEVAVLGPNASAEQAFEQLTRKDSEEVPVVLDGRLLGMLYRADVLRWLTLSGGPGVSSPLAPSH